MKSIEFIKTDDGRTFSNMSDSSPCAQCGACCNHFRVSFYVGEINYGENTGTVPHQFVTKITDTIAAMKNTECGGRCAAFEGVVGKESKCAIYSERPSTCREYHAYNENGEINPKCNELRIKFGLDCLQ